jgi:hypothetical protein
MISSRNNDLIPDGDSAISLSKVRKRLQKDLQAERFCSQLLLEVWINEDAGAESGDESAWEACLKQVEEADIVVAIYNGHAGWVKTEDGVGICHAEMERALSRYPAKLRLIQLDFDSNKKLKLIGPKELSTKTKTNQEFSEYVQLNARFVGFAKDRDSLQQQVYLAVAKAISQCVELARREMHRGKFHLGDPLDWSRMSYSERKLAMERAAREHLIGLPGTTEAGEDLICSLCGARVIFRVHGVPAGFGTAEARDLVGRPFLADHLTSAARVNSGVIGPVHIIACHKSCTESQVVSFLGHPDLFIVKPPFGFLVADGASFVQAVFLPNCRDETMTRLAIQSMFEWAGQSSEDMRIVERAKSRASILQATAKEIERLAKTIVESR